MDKLFKPGKFYLCSSDGTFVVFPWPDLRVFQVASGPNWGVQSDSFNLSDMEEIASKEEDFRASGDENGVKRARMCRVFLDSIPNEVLNTVKGFSDRHRPILNIIAKCPQFMDLAASNPGLAYCLVIFRHLHKPAPVNYLRSIRCLVRKRQRDIAGRLGFPAADSTVTILKKIKKGSLSALIIKDIRTCLRTSEARKMLQYVPISSRGMVMIIKNSALRKMVTPALFRNLAETYNGPTCYFHLKDILEMSKIIGRPVHHGFKSFKKVTEEYNRLRCDLGAMVEAGKIKLEFPRPPYPGNEDIIPLDSPEKLIREGKEQSNCLRGEILSVLNGRSYFYKVIDPQRATLELINIEYPMEKTKIPWSTRRLKAFNNTDVLNVTEGSVKRWFENVLNSRPTDVR